MDIRDRKTIHHTAAQVLDGAGGESKKIALFYAGFCCLLSLLGMVISVGLSSRIADTGGLRNMGLRSILSTGQTILPIVQLVVTSCLGLGYQIAVLNMVRNRPASHRMLLEGFRWFGPLLRLLLLEGILYLAIGMGTMYLSISIFLVLPMAQSYYDVMEPVINSTSVLDSSVSMDEATLLSAMDALMPMMWIWLIVFLLVLIPISYKLRMAELALADAPRKGAVAAIRESFRRMRKNGAALFRLDLNLWWFYALQVLISVVCYGDLLLPMVGVTFPWSDTVSYYLFYCLSLGLQFVVYYFLLNRVYVTYAVAYETLGQKKVPEKPQNPFLTES